MNDITGYKCFDKGLRTRYNEQLEVGETYTCATEARFQEKGYHFCARLEDTLRYFDGMNKEVDICKVIGRGDIHVSEDTYNDYYDMYSASNIEIVKLLSREEIMNLMIDPNKVIPSRILRFIMGYKLSDDEINKVLDNYSDPNIVPTINYYQRGELDAFRRRER